VVVGMECKVSAKNVYDAEEGTFEVIISLARHGAIGNRKWKMETETVKT